ncbi:hypothetical protein CYMTET_19081, partial [Cymbomonas tetramitiformis]
QDPRVVVAQLDVDIEEKDAETKLANFITAMRFIARMGCEVSTSGASLHMDDELLLLTCACWRSSLQFYAVRSALHALHVRGTCVDLPAPEPFSEPSPYQSPSPPKLNMSESKQRKSTSKNTTRSRASTVGNAPTNHAAVIQHQANRKSSGRLSSGRLWQKGLEKKHKGIDTMLELSASVLRPHRSPQGSPKSPSKKAVDQNGPLCIMAGKAIPVVCQSHFMVEAVLVLNLDTNLYEVADDASCLSVPLAENVAGALRNIEEGRTVGEPREEDADGSLTSIPVNLQTDLRSCSSTMTQYKHQLNGIWRFHCCLDSGGENGYSMTKMQINLAGFRKFLNTIDFKPTMDQHETKQLYEKSLQAHNHIVTPVRGIRPARRNNLGRGGVRELWNRGRQSIIVGKLTSQKNVQSPSAGKKQPPQETAMGFQVRHPERPPTPPRLLA